MLKALLWLLRVCAYLFHLLLGLFLIGMGFVALISNHPLTLGMLPWQGGNLTLAVFLMGAAGILCVLLAATGAIRWLFPLWALFVLVMLFRGYFATSYSFSSGSELRFAAWMTVIALVAFLASLSLFGRRRR